MGLAGSMYLEKYFFISFQIEWNIIVATVIPSILNQREFIWIKIEGKTVATILFHSICKEMKIYFYECGNTIQQVATLKDLK